MSWQSRAPGRDGHWSSRSGGGYGDSGYSSRYSSHDQHHHSSSGSERRVFTGTVTKLHDNFGFVDEDVFFQPQVVRGALPRIGEKVIVEAGFNPNMPFKWTATRIQAVNSPASGDPGRYDRSRDPKRYSMQTHRSNSREEDSRSGPVPYVAKTYPKRPVAPEPVRSLSKRKNTPSPRRVISRYVCRLPKHDIGRSFLNASLLLYRHPMMYVPSDFFFAKSHWSDVFPRERPFPLGSFCDFHVLRKEVDPPATLIISPDPQDACYLYQAKVMLMSGPILEDLYQRSCRINGGDVDGTTQSLSHLSRLIYFLVGTKNRTEIMAIGGPWSPSLDGEDPENPKVLIKTAIRNALSLTGIDLSKCTKWYKFVEFHYLRSGPVSNSCKSGVCPTSVDAERLTVEASAQTYHLERVVIYVPDVWNCMPTAVEWEAMNQLYKDGCARRIEALTSQPSSVPAAADQESDKEGVKQKLTTDSDDKLPADDHPGKIEDQDSTLPDAAEQVVSQPVDDDECEREPTPYSQLDIKNMKVAELKNELLARKQPASGLKQQLAARLQRCLDQERTKDEQSKATAASVESQPSVAEVEPAVTSSTKDAPSKDDTSAKETSVQSASKPTAAAPAAPVKPAEQPSKETIERLYTLPKAPSILVHSSRTAKGGKFECSARSLQSLLEYRQDDTKEHSFEVYVFAELFQEMLYRDQGYTVFRALYRAFVKKLVEEARTSAREEESARVNADEATKADGSEKGGDGEKADEIDAEELEVKEELGENDEPDAKRLRSDSSRSTVTKNEADSRSASSQKNAASKKPGKKYVTFDKPLLFAFSFFDCNGTDHLLDKDVETVLHLSGIEITRAQAKEIVTKLLTSARLEYRSLTDKATDVAHNGEASVSEPKHDMDTASTDAELLSRPWDTDEDPFIHNGNAGLLPQSNIKNEDMSAFANKPHPSQQHDAGVVMFQGAVVDVASTVEKLDYSEKRCQELDYRLRKVTTDYAASQQKIVRNDDVIKQLETDVRESKRRYEELREKMTKFRHGCERFKNMALTIKDRMRASVDLLDIVMEEVFPAKEKEGESTSAAAPEKGEPAKPIDSEPEKNQPNAS